MSSSFNFPCCFHSYPGLQKTAVNGRLSLSLVIFDMFVNMFIVKLELLNIGRHIGCVFVGQCLETT